MSEKEEKKKIEIISNPEDSTLDISPLYEDINSVTPKDEEKKPKNIIIPKEKNKE